MAWRRVSGVSEKASVEVAEGADAIFGRQRIAGHERERRILDRISLRRTVRFALGPEGESTGPLSLLSGMALGNDSRSPAASVAARPTSAA